MIRQILQSDSDRSSHAARRLARGLAALGHVAVSHKIGVITRLLRVFAQGLSSISGCVPLKFLTVFCCGCYKPMTNTKSVYY